MQWTESVDNFLGRMDRRDREAGAPALPLIPLARAHQWLRVDAIARFWDNAQRTEIDPMEQVLVALHGAGRAPALLLLSDATELAVCLGVRLPFGPDALVERRADTVPMLLCGLLPGVELTPISSAEIERKLTHIALYRGRLTGAPGEAAPHRSRDTPSNSLISGWHTASELPIERIERVVRGLRGREWAWLVTANGIAREETRAERDEFLEAVRHFASMATDTVAQTPTQTSQRQGGGEMLALETASRLVSRLENGLTVGYWQTHSGFWAVDDETLRLVSALLASAFAGASSHQEPLRFFDLGREAAGAAEALDDGTALTSTELAVFMRLPRVESQGYQVRPYARFDLAVARPSADTLALGVVRDGMASTNARLVVERENLVRHGLLAGVTRSGKTTTAQHLLCLLRTRSNPTPFLVIEPAKREYRNLLRMGADSAWEDLIVFTLGDEHVSPLRLNPFEFPIQAGMHVQMHIDFVKAAFNAAFAMYPPMPFVLERALVDIYEDAGWDLVSGENTRVAHTSSHPRCVPDTGRSPCQDSRCRRSVTVR